MKHNGIVRLNFTRHERVGATRNFGKVTHTVRFDEMNLKKVMRKALKYGIPFRYGEVETKEGKITAPNYIVFNFELNYFAGGLSERLKDGAFFKRLVYVEYATTEIFADITKRGKRHNAARNERNCGKSNELRRSYERFVS